MLTLLLCVQFLSAQESDIVEEWIQKDLKATQLIPDLVKQQPIDPKVIGKMIGARYHELPEDLGFDATRIDIRQGFGYTGIRVSLFLFKDKIINYQVLLGGSLSWKKVREKIIDAWKQKVGVPFKENETGIYFEITNPLILSEYKAFVADELGELNNTEIPRSIKADYEYLMSPNRNSVVGKDPCGVAGMIPQGKESIDILVNSRKIELIENVLRGYNPGGRVYAMVALLEMKNRDIKLSPDTENTIRKIVETNIKLQVCEGGSISMKTASQVLNDYQLEV